MKYLCIVHLYEFLNHIHIADEFVYKLFQILTSFIRRVAIGAAQRIIHKIGIKATAGSRLYGVIVSIRFHVHISFLFDDTKMSESCFRCMWGRLQFYLTRIKSYPGEKESYLTTYIYFPHGIKKIIT